MLRTHAPRRRIALVASVVTLAAIMLTGCQTVGPDASANATTQADLPPLSTLTPIADPTSWEGPSTAVIGGPSIDPVADKPKQQLPVTVTSHDVTGDREVQVLVGMSNGRSNAQIGVDLFLSEDTVKTHARRLFRKLGANDRAQAVAIGLRRGLIR